MTDVKLLNLECASHHWAKRMCKVPAFGYLVDLGSWHLLVRDTVSDGEEYVLYD